MEELFEIENENGLMFHVQEVEPVIVGQNGKEIPQHHEVMFCVENVEKDDLQPDGSLCINVSKLEAARLGIQLLKMAYNDSPTMGSEVHAFNHRLSISEYVNTRPFPHLTIHDIAEGDVDNEGKLHVCLSRQNAEVIATALTKFV